MVPGQRNRSVFTKVLLNTTFGLDWGVHHGLPSGEETQEVKHKKQHLTLLPKNAYGIYVYESNKGVPPNPSASSAWATTR